MYPGTKLRLGISKVQTRHFTETSSLSTVRKLPATSEVLILKDQDLWCPYEKLKGMISPPVSGDTIWRFHFIRFQ